MGYKWQSNFYRGTWGKIFTTLGGNKNLTYNQTRDALFSHDFSQVNGFNRKLNSTAKLTTLFTDRPFVVRFIRPFGFCLSLETIDRPKPGEDLLLYVYINKSIDSSLDVLVTDPGKQVYYAVSESSFSGHHIGYTEQANKTQKPMLYFDLEVNTGGNKRLRNCH